MRVVFSKRPGMGKSLCIKKLKGDSVNDISHCIVPIHGPKVDFDTVVKLLDQYTPEYQSSSDQIIHIDIDCEVCISVRHMVACHVAQEANVA